MEREREEPRGKGYGPELGGQRERERPKVAGQWLRRVNNDPITMLGKRRRRTMMIRIGV